MSTKSRNSTAEVKKILDDCLKQPGNRTCAECGSKQPRWASTNIGVFVCIRCSGIHRNLGVHISKVKSVSLDAWPLELAEHIQSLGNEAVNAVYEATLPSGRKPTEETGNYETENFIRDKYANKKWYRDDGQASRRKKKVAPKSHRRSPAAVAAAVDLILRKTGPKNERRNPKRRRLKNPKPDQRMEGKEKVPASPNQRRSSKNQRKLNDNQQLRDPNRIRDPKILAFLAQTLMLSFPICR